MATTPYIGEIRTFAFGFPPKGWAQCNGQLLPINQNQALYALLGTTYGGNGIQTFGLPNLLGRVPVGSGSGSTLGAQTGSASGALTTAQIPAHTHNANGSTAPILNGTGTPGPTVLPGTFAAGSKYYGTPANATFGGNAVGPAGNQPHENRQPYLTLNLCIALQGIFPPRN